MCNEKELFFPSTFASVFIFIYITLHYVLSRHARNTDFRASIHLCTRMFSFGMLCCRREHVFLPENSRMHCTPFNVSSVCVLLARSPDGLPPRCICCRSVNTAHRRRGKNPCTGVLGWLQKCVTGKMEFSHFRVERRAMKHRLRVQLTSACTLIGE